MGVYGEGGSFDDFFAEAEPRLRRALVATYGAERGREATAEALAWAWEHWAEVVEMSNPFGYLYRVGQSRTRDRKRPDIPPAAPVEAESWMKPELERLLAGLTERQRVCVVLVHGFGWTLQEVADLIGSSITTVRRHASKGLVRLQGAFEVKSA